VQLLNCYRHFSFASLVRYAIGYSSDIDIFVLSFSEDIYARCIAQAGPIISEHIHRWYIDNNYSHIKFNFFASKNTRIRRISPLRVSRARVRCQSMLSSNIEFIIKFIDMYLRISDPRYLNEISAGKTYRQPSVNIHRRHSVSATPHSRIIVSRETLGRQRILHDGVPKSTRVYSAGASLSPPAHAGDVHYSSMRPLRYRNRHPFLP